ncbi:MAG TPA: ATP-dependent 6-phosphofructokinase [Armatimonadota bacterium]|nr:ATP-dependent 6-phosphofructokinase [Armatimonadota bacterium]
MAEPARIGVLTGGGDAPGLNAVIRGVVKAAAQLGWEVLGFEKGYEGLVDPVHYRPLTPENTKGILHLGGTILGTVNRGRFAAKVGLGEERCIDPAILAQARETVRALELRGLVCIGGDGSLSIAQQLFDAGVPVVGVPKTIDNDLNATFLTFGFDSAVAFATEALDRLHTTACSHERVMCLEVMGRYAGWIALYAGIAGGADVILSPEIAWSFDSVIAKIRRRYDSGRRFAIVVVAEGARWPDGALIAVADQSGGKGEVRLGGIGERVACEIEGRTGIQSRYVVLGHLQRGGPPTTFDRLLATRFGVSAVRLLAEGRFGRMVSFQPPDIRDVSLEEAVGALRTVPPDGDIVRTARALGICLGDG